MKSTSLLLFFVIIYGIGNAQNLVDTIQLSSRYTNHDHAYLDTIEEQMLILEEREITVNITMASDSLVLQLLVILGTDEGSNNILNKNFDYSLNGNFSDGTSYQRSGNSITIVTGRFSGMPRYYIEVIPVLQDGTMSPGASNVLE
jgi:hypothetical protein